MKQIIPRLKYHFSKKPKSFYEEFFGSPKRARGGLALDEAMKILSIEKNQLNIETLQKRACVMYQLNDARDGGSPYI